MNPVLSTADHYIVAGRKGAPESDAIEAFGMATWLWLRSPLHREWPVALLNAYVLPAIREGQYALVRNDKIPLAFGTWCRLSAEAERRFLYNPNRLQQADWTSGERVWVVDLAAPFGHAGVFGRFMRERFRTTHPVVRSMRVRAGSDTSRIIEFYSPDFSTVTKNQNRQEFLGNYKAAFDQKL